jgi:protein-S-isoprenylcysteine O-methyltransferase Ste14
MRRPTAAAGSALFFAVAPGVVAGLVPWWLTGWRVRGPLAHWAPVRVAGLIMLIAGAIVLIQAFARFVTEGHGTPAPVAPTEHLVIGGLYRYVRNPMYLAVVAAITGQALALGQPVLLGYAAAVWVTVASFVRWYEEPALTHQFGAQYRAYRRSVRAWLPRIRAWRPGEQGPGSPDGLTAVRRLADEIAARWPSSLRPQPA